MKPLTEILPGVWCVEVEADAKYISDSPERFEILGYATKDEISFDVSGIAESEDKFWGENKGKMYVDYSYKKKMFQAGMTAEESFRSLLLKNELYWGNPLHEHFSKEPNLIDALNMDWSEEEFESIVEQYKEYERNRLTGKLIFIKKVK